MRLHYCLALALVLVSASSLQAQTYTETDIHNFAYTDGGYPVASLIQAHDGNFYGSTYTGGANEDGAAFKVTAGGTFTLLHSFSTGIDGGAPTGQLIEGPDGNLYGTCAAGGTYGYGTIYKMTPSGAVTVLYNFSNASDGEGPSPLVLATDGNYWGTSLGGANSGVGVIFKITPSGSFTPVYTFPASGSQGYDPTGIQLLQASDGRLYGTVTQTPPNEISLHRPGGKRAARSPMVEPTPSFTDGGIIYSISVSGGFATAYAFGSSDGADPNVSLVEGQNTRLYGEYFYSLNGYGEIYSIPLGGGSLVNMYNFSGGTDNGSPEGALFLASDGNFYGTASSSSVTTGYDGGGTFFKFTPAGSLSTLYTFDSKNATEGGNPDAGVVQGSDGSFYGTNYSQGDYNGQDCSQFGCGDLYKIVATPALTAPVQLSLSSATTAPGTAVTLNWKVLNAFSDTMQLCYAYNSGTGAGTTWTGKQTGTLSSTTHLYTGSAQITPTADGTYTYALTCGGQEAGSVVLTVSGKGKTSSATTLKASPTAPVIGQSVTLTATVAASGNGTATGSVAFSALGIALGTETLSGSGTASLTQSTAGLGAGTYPVEAAYSGDSDYDSSTATLNVTVTKGATTTTLTANPSSVTPPASVTLTATVKRTTSGISGSPTGSVTFSVDGATLGTATLNGSGVATYAASTNGVGAGSYPVIATYNGDNGDDTSVSAAQTVTVK